MSTFATVWPAEKMKMPISYLSLIFTGHCFTSVVVSWGSMFVTGSLKHTRRSTQCTESCFHCSKSKRRESERQDQTDRNIMAAAKRLMQLLVCSHRTRGLEWTIHTDRERCTCSHQANRFQPPFGLAPTTQRLKHMRAPVFSSPQCERRPTPPTYYGDFSGDSSH